MSDPCKELHDAWQKAIKKRHEWRVKSSFATFKELDENEDLIPIVLTPEQEEAHQKYLEALDEEKQAFQKLRECYKEHGLLK